MLPRQPAPGKNAITLATEANLRACLPAVSLAAGRQPARRLGLPPLHWLTLARAPSEGLLVLRMMCGMALFEDGGVQLKKGVAVSRAVLASVRGAGKEKVPPLFSFVQVSVGCRVGRPPLGSSWCPGRSTAGCQEEWATWSEILHISDLYVVIYLMQSTIFMACRHQAAQGRPSI